MSRYWEMGVYLYSWTLRLLQQWKSGTRPIDQRQQKRWKRRLQLFRNLPHPPTPHRQTAAPLPVVHCTEYLGANRRFQEPSPETVTQQSGVWPSNSAFPQPSHVVLRPFLKETYSRDVIDPENKYMKCHSLQSWVDHSLKLCSFKTVPYARLKLILLS